MRLWFQSEDSNREVAEHEQLNLTGRREKKSYRDNDQARHLKYAQ
jgi:hypothetical protein